MQAAHQVEPEHIALNTTSSLWNFFFTEIIATNKDYQSKKEEKGSLKQSTQLHCRCSVTQFCPTLLWPHELQHARLPCPSPSPRICSVSCPLSQWCHLTILSSVASFSSRSQSFPPASGHLSHQNPMSQLFASGGQNTEASASVLPMNIQGWFPLALTCWSLCYSRDSQVSSPAPQYVTSIIS